MNKTVLYYTGNKKNKSFELKIRDTLLKNSMGLPIVSVSQNPINFGKNICVGDVGASYINVYRQMLIGAAAVETEYFIFAEDDTIYPKEYFEYNPNGGNFYRYGNCWVVLWRGSYYRTKPVGGFVKRDFAIETLTEFLDGEPEWLDDPSWRGKPDFMGKPFEVFTGPPLVAFKPTNNITKSSYTFPEKTRNLPPYGNVDRLRRQYDFD